MQLLIIPPLPLLFVISVLLALIILAFVIPSGRKEADKILRERYRWDPWNRVWYAIIEIEDGDMVLPGVILSESKDGSGYVQTYPFRDYSLRGAIDNFKNKCCHHNMMESLKKIL